MEEFSFVKIQYTYVFGGTRIKEKKVIKKLKSRTKQKISSATFGEIQYGRFFARSLLEIPTCKLWLLRKTTAGNYQFKKLKKNCGRVVAIKMQIQELRLHRPHLYLAIIELSSLEEDVLLKMILSCFEANAF